jgi:hypothetical protein
MANLIDNVWLWGQTPNSHHACAAYHLPGVNRMTPKEGCEFFGIRNCCRVAMSKGPFPPFDDETADLKDMEHVIWSILGAGGVHRNEETTGDLEEVIRQAQMFPNVSGAIMDDFLLNDTRRNWYPPEKLQQMKERLCREAGRPMELWTVYYDREMDLDVQDYLEVFDVITYWTWYGEHILDLSQNLEQLFKKYPQKKIMAGCYMWDYGNGRPLPPELMELQLETYRKYMIAGKLQGFILCSNCIADLGIAAVEQTRQWLLQHGNETL